MGKTSRSLSATNKAIDELIKFSGLDPWRERREQVVRAHVLPMCEKLGMEPEDLQEILGDGGYTMLWGCAFEDFLTRRYPPEGLSVVDDFLKRRGWRVPVAGKQYVAALRDSVPGLYEVMETSPGAHMILKDLLRESPPLTVFDKAASESVDKWDLLMARLMGDGSKTRMSGAALRFKTDRADRIREVVDVAVRDMMETARKLGHDRKSDGAMTPEKALDALLEGSATMFTGLWILDTVKQSQRPAPKLVNMEGDALLPSEIRYRVDPQATGALEKKLSEIPGLERDPGPKKFWNWLEEGNAKGKLRDDGDGISFGTVTDTGFRVLGTLELTGAHLVVSVNSLERAEKGKALLAKHAGDLLGTPLTSHQSPEKLLEERREPKEADEDGGQLQLSLEEQADILHELMDRHYRQVLQEPIPALGHRTPRQAMRSKAGREQLRQWLKNLENNEARRARNQGGAPYDTRWMWRELGLDPDQPGQKKTGTPRAVSGKEPVSTKSDGNPPADQPSASDPGPPPKVPVALRPLYEEIVALTDAFCARHLTEGYARLARAMTAALCRKRPSPLLKGRSLSWAAGVLYALGQNNFLWDPSFEPHMTATDLCSAIGVSSGTASGKAREISDRLDISPADAEWCIPEVIGRNPMIWILEVNGVALDIRQAPHDIQDLAFEKGLIPYVPYRKDP